MFTYVTTFNVLGLLLDAVCHFRMEDLNMYLAC